MPYRNYHTALVTILFKRSRNVLLFALTLCATTTLLISKPGERLLTPAN